MKKTTLLKSLVISTLLGVPLLSPAATFWLTNNDAINTSSFTNKLNWNSSAAPSAGNSYVVSNATHNLRTPVSDTLSAAFKGDSLTFSNGGILLYKGGSASVVITVTNLILDGGVVQNAAIGGATFTLAGSNFVAAAGGAFTGNNGNITNNAIIAGTGSLFFSNNPSILNGANGGFTGRIIIGGASAGTVIVDSQVRLGGNPATFTANQLTFNNGTLQPSASFALDDSNRGITLTGAGTFNLAAGITLSVPNPIVGAGALTKSGAGVLTLSGSNGFTGSLTLSGATAGSRLNIASTNALGRGTFTVTSGDNATLDNTSGGALVLTANNPVQLNNNFTFAGSNDLHLGFGAVTLAAARTITVSSNTLSLGGTVGGAFSLTKAGAGTLALQASNAFSGGLTISGGTVVMSNPNALGTNGMTFGTGSTLVMATDGGDYPNVVNAGSGSTWTIASDVKTGTLGINHTLGTFLIGSGATPLVMNVVKGPGVSGGNPQITANAMTLSGGSGGTTILNPTTAKLAIGNVTASATSKTLQLDGTAAGNAISGAITDGGANVITLVKSNASTWTLSAPNTYSGSTTVGAGTLALSGSGSLASPVINVANGGTLDVSAATFILGASQTLLGNGTVVGNTADTTGTQIVPGGAGLAGILTFNGNLSLAIGDTNRFDFLSGTNDSIVVTGNLTPSVGSVINLASLPPGGLPNGTYTLFTIGGTLGGSATDFVVTGKPFPSRQTFNIVYASSPNRVQLQVGGSAANIVWLGTSAAWDITTSQNWTNAASVSADFYYDGDNVSLTDLGAGLSPVLNTNVQPGSVTVNSSSAYSLTGNGKIGGSTGLTKSGGGTFSIGTTNDYTGITALNGGTVSITTIANGGQASPLGAASSASANLTFNGGTLQFAGTTGSTDRGATLNAGGGSVDITPSSALVVSGVVAGGNGGSLTKTGNGTLVLSGANTYNGNTAVSGGVLQVGNNGGTGNLGSGAAIANNSAIRVYRTGTLTLTNAITGAGSLTNDGTGTLVLAGNNTYLGVTAVNTGIVQVASTTALGGTPASFDPAHISINVGELEAATTFSLADTNSGVSVNAGTIGVDAGQTLTISNQINVATSLTKSRPGTLILGGSNTIAGVLNVDTASTTASDGALRITTTNALGGAPLVQIRNNQVAGSSTFQIDGSNENMEITNAFAWSGRNNLIAGIQSLAGDNIWNPAAVTFNSGGTFYTFQADAGTLTLPGTFPTTAPAAARNLVFAGAGNTRVTGSIQNGGSVISVIKTNSGTLDLLGSSSYTGLTSVHGGTMSLGDGVSLGAATANIEIAPLTGQVATLNVSNATVNAQRVIIAGVSANTGTPGTGTLNQVSGTLNSAQWFTVGSGGASGGTGTYNLSGDGVLNVQGQQVEVANFNGSSGTVNMSGSSTLNIWNGNFLSLGANAGAANGTFNQNGGSVTFYSDAGATVGGNGTLYLGRASGLTSNYVYRLNGGTLTVPTITSASGNSQFYLNGGTLKAARTNLNWMSGLTAAYVSSTRTTIDDGGYVVGISQPLIHDPALVNDGGIRKLGSGTLYLNGTNTFNNSVNVAQGSFGGNGTIADFVNVLEGATFAPGAGIGIMTVANLNFDQNSTVQFNFGTATNSKVVATGVIEAITGSVTVNINYLNAVPAVGTYTLMQYGTLSGFGNFVAPTSPNPRFTFALNNNTTAKTVELIVTGSPTNLVWDGSVSTTWDNTSSGPDNWHKGTFAGPLDKFYDGDAVRFDDNGWAGGSVSFNVNASPSSVTVSNSFGNNYDIAGAGVIAGPGGLTKLGGGGLVLEVNSSYTGPTIISGGAVSLGNGGTSGSLGSGVVTNNAQLYLYRSDAVVMPSPIYGTGSVFMYGSGSVLASGSNYYTGNTIINGGIAFLANANGLGDTNGMISVGPGPGSQLYITANVDNGGNPLVLYGAGDGNGALRKGGAGTSVYRGTVDLAGDTTLSVDGGATLNLASTNGLNGAAANANLTLVGSGAGIFGGPLTLGAGGVTQSFGSWTYAATNNYTGLTVLNGGAARVTGGSLGNPAVFTPDQITLAGAVLQAITNVTFNDGKAGFTVLANSALAVDNGFTLAISNQISGGAILTKTGAGTLVLGVSNSFNGTLNLDTASISGNDGAVRITTSNALINVASPILSRNNNGGRSILQLDGSAGPITVPQAFTVTCRNSGVPWIQNLAGNNALVSPLSIEVGGGALLFQSDAGELELSGGISYIGTATGSRTYTFTGAGSHLVSGAINNSGNGAPINVAMNGTGRLVLSAANTYGNTTTVSSGQLLVNGSITSTGVVTVVGGTLGGTGTINTEVTVQSGGTLSPGASIGTLTIASNLTLAGTTFIEVNKTLNTSDQVIGLTNVNYGGTLFATNVSGTLNIGDSFPVFSSVARSGNFSVITGTPGAGKAWAFNPATGVLSVVAGIASNPTNITFSVTGNAMTLSWPADHQGWILQAQTNSLTTGLAGNWVDIAGSESSTQAVVNIQATNPAVFFRLRQP
ncbi:MAG: autotransporter-associated beta strand repeat-containing protein [Verrucomicrobiota bacterium]